MRCEFEKLPEIAERLQAYEHLFDFKLNQYLCTDLQAEHYLNGAWMAYQEQQKIINELLGLCADKAVEI